MTLLFIILAILLMLAFTGRAVMVAKLFLIGILIVPIASMVGGD
jgi:hypothetical protein